MILDGIGEQGMGPRIGEWGLGNRGPGNGDPS